MGLGWDSRVVQREFVSTGVKRKARFAEKVSLFGFFCFPTRPRGGRTHLVRERFVERQRVCFHDELQLRADQGFHIKRRDSAGRRGRVPGPGRVLVVFG